MIDDLKSNSIKIKKFIDKDYLFWIYPLIILGLIIFTVLRDKHLSESTSFTNPNVKVDSSITMITQPRMIDSLKIY
jgi:hypothetical protein